MTEKINEVEVTTEAVVNDSELTEGCAEVSESRGINFTVKDGLGLALLGLAAKGAWDLSKPVVKKVSDKIGLTDKIEEFKDARQAAKEAKKKAREERKAAREAAKAEAKKNKSEKTK